MAKRAETAKLQQRRNCSCCRATDAAFRVDFRRVGSATIVANNYKKKLFIRYRDFHVWASKSLACSAV